MDSSNPQEVNDGIYGNPFSLFSRADDAIDFITQVGFCDAFRPFYAHSHNQAYQYVVLALGFALTASLLAPAVVSLLFLDAYAYCYLYGYLAAGALNSRECLNWHPQLHHVVCLQPGDSVSCGASRRPQHSSLLRKTSSPTLSFLSPILPCRGRLSALQDLLQSWSIIRVCRCLESNWLSLFSGSANMVYVPMPPLAWRTRHYPQRFSPQRGLADLLRSLFPSSTVEGPSPKRLGYLTKFDTFQSILALHTTFRQCHASDESFLLNPTELSS